MIRLILLSVCVVFSSAKCPSVAELWSFATIPVNGNYVANSVMRATAGASYQYNASYSGNAVTIGREGYVALDWFELGGTDFTVTTAFRVQSIEDNANIFSFGSGNQYSNQVYGSLLASLNGIKVGHGSLDPNGINRVDYTISILGILSVNTLIHLVSSFYANGTLAVYINGNLAGSTVLPVTVPYANRTTAYLGRSQFDTDGKFVGDMLNVSIYTEALDAPVVIGAIYGGNTINCPAFHLENTFSSFRLGSDTNTSNPFPNFQGEMFDFQLYNYNLLKGTDSCSPAPPPAPLAPPAPPFPFPPPPQPPAPPTFSFDDDTLSGTLSLTINANNSYNWLNFGWAERVNMTYAIAELVGLQNVQDVLLTEFVDGGIDDYDNPIVIMGFVIRQPNSDYTYTVDSIDEFMNFVLPANTPGDMAFDVFSSHLVSPNGNTDNVVAISIINGLGISKVSTSVFPGASTTIYLNGTTLDAFDRSEAKALAAGINTALGLPETSTYVSGLARAFDHNNKELVAVGIDMYGISNDQAQSYISQLNNLLPSGPAQNSHLIASINQMGVTSVYSMLTQAAINELLMPQVSTDAFEFGTLACQIQGVDLEDFNLIVQAEFASIIEHALDMTKGTLGVLGVAQADDDATLVVGLSLLTTLSTSAEEELDSLTDFDTDTLLLQLQQSGLPQISSIAIIGPGVIRGWAVAPQPTEYVLALGMHITWTSTEAPGDAHFAALASDLASEIAVDDQRVYVTSTSAADTSSFYVGYAIAFESNIDMNAAVLLLDQHVSTKSIYGLPQVMTTSVTGIKLGAPQKMNNFSAPAASTILTLYFQPTLVAWSAPHERIIHAAFASALNMPAGALVVGDIDATASGVATLSIAVFGDATAALLMQHTAPITQPLNINLLLMLQACGLPSLVAISTANGADADVVLVSQTERVDTVSPYVVGFGLQFRYVIPDFAIPLLNGVMGSAAGVDSSVITTSLFPAVSATTIGLLVNCASEGEANAVLERVNASTFASIITSIIDTSLFDITGVSMPDITGLTPAPITQVTSSTAVAVTINLNFGMPTPMSLAQQAHAMACFVYANQLASNCCALVASAATSNGAYVSINVASANAAFNETALTYQLQTSGQPTLRSAQISLIAPTAPQPQTFTNAVVSTITLGGLVDASMSTIQDQVFTAILCNVLGLDPGCVGISGSQNDGLYQQYGLVFGTYDEPTLLGIQDDLDQVLTSSASMLTALQSNGFPALTSASQAVSPALFEQPTIVNGPHPCVAASLALLNTFPYAIELEERAALVAGLAVYFGTPAYNVELTSLTLSYSGEQPVTNVGFLLQAASADQATTVIEMTSFSLESLVSTMQNTGFPNVSQILFPATPLVGTPSLYNASLAGNFSANFNVGFFGLTEPDCNRLAVQTAMRAALAATLDLASSCVYISNTTCQVVGNELVLGFVINCRQSGAVFTKRAQPIALVSAFEQQFPSPDESTTFVDNLRAAGLTQIESCVQLTSINVYNIITPAPNENETAAPASAKASILMPILFGVGGIIGTIGIAVGITAIVISKMPPEKRSRVLMKIFHRSAPLPNKEK